MNKEYIYLDGKCIIEDDNGNQKVEDYTNKTDEILMKENAIEMLEKEQDDTTKEIEKKEGQTKILKFSIYFNAIMSLLILPTIQLLIRMLIGPGASVILASENLVVLNFLKWFIISITAFYGTVTTCSAYNSYKKNNRSIKGLYNKKKELDKTLEEDRIELQKLHEEKQIEKSETYFYKKEFCNLELLRKLRNYLNLYYDCGYNREKYQKYLEQGKLDKKLRRYYNEHGIELIKENLEENSQEMQKTLSK